MSEVNRVLVEYIDLLKEENRKLRRENSELKPIADQPFDIKKAIHDASNVLGNLKYSITDPDSMAVAWVNDVTHLVLDFRAEKIRK